MDIELIAVGDYVLSRCEVTGEIDYKKVLRIFKHEFPDDNDVVDVVYQRDPDYSEDLSHPVWQPRTTTTTLEHPFWVRGKGWTSARKLKAGDELFTSDGKPAHVLSVEPCSAPNYVCNFEVEDFHTYFVGEPGVWVRTVKNMQQP